MESKEVSIRELWPHEERDFSVWLWNNIGLLSDVIGIKLIPVNRELNVQGFQLDMLAVDPRGEKVAIESQLSRSDHDHLGKLITYATNIGATAAVWITPKITIAHSNAVTVLDQRIDGMRVFAVQVSVQKMLDGELVPSLSLVSKEQETSTKSARRTEPKAEENWKYEFWSKLLYRAKQKGLALHECARPSDKNAIGASSGFNGFAYRYLIREGGKVGIELYIFVSGNATKTKSLFEALVPMRVQIEKDFGNSLTWEKLEGKGRSRVRHLFDYVIAPDGTNWDRAFEDMTNAMNRFHRIVQPALRQVGTPS